MGAATTGWTLPLVVDSADPTLDAVRIYCSTFDGDRWPTTGITDKDRWDVGDTDAGYLFTVTAADIAAGPVAVPSSIMARFASGAAKGFEFDGVNSGGALVDVALDGWAMTRTGGTSTETYPLMGTIDTGWVTVAERTIVSGTDTRSKLDLMREVADSSLAILLETFLGQVEYQDANRRQPRTPDMVLDCAHILKDLVWRNDIANLLNSLDYTWGDPHHADAATRKGRVTDAASIATHGTWGSSTHLALSNATDAATIATQMIAWRSDPFWTLETMPVRLETVPSVPVALTSHISACFQTTGIPEPTPAVSSIWWLEGASEVLSIFGWQANWYVSPRDTSVIPA
jgi:hypothetical protein